MFDNDYLFELKYVDSAIRKKKHRKKLITGRMRNLETQIAALKIRQKQEKIPCHLISPNRTRKWKNCDEQERLEKVFAQCVKSKKPLVCEDIRHIRQKPLYRNKKRNRHISMFAYRTIQQLIHSKENKYGVAVFEVNPAYTSQIGKYKYAKPYGLSAHEAAAYVIVRRGQRRKERVPQSLRIFISEDEKTSAYFKQWNSVLKTLNSKDN